MHRAHNAIQSCKSWSIHWFIVHPVTSDFRYKYQKPSCQNGWWIGVSPKSIPVNFQGNSSSFHTCPLLAILGAPGCLYLLARPGQWCHEGWQESNSTKKIHQADLCESVKTFCYCMYPNQLTSCLFAIHLHQRWRCSLLGCPWRGRWNASAQHWSLVDFSLIVPERPFKEKEMKLDVSSVKHLCFYLNFGHKGLQCNCIHDLQIKPRKHISHH